MLSHVCAGKGGRALTGLLWKSTLTSIVRREAMNGWMPWIVIIPPYTERDLRQLPDNIWRSAMEIYCRSSRGPFP